MKGRKAGEGGYRRQNGNCSNSGWSGGTSNFEEMRERNGLPKKKGSDSEEKKRGQLDPRKRKREPRTETLDTRWGKSVVVQNGEIGEKRKYYAKPWKRKERSAFIKNRGARNATKIFRIRLINWKGG